MNIIPKCGYNCPDDTDAVVFHMFDFWPNYFCLDCMNELIEEDGCDPDEFTPLEGHLCDIEQHLGYDYSHM